MLQANVDEFCGFIAKLKMKHVTVELTVLTDAFDRFVLPEGFEPIRQRFRLREPKLYILRKFSSQQRMVLSPLDARSQT